MGVAEQFSPIRERFYDISSDFFGWIGSFFGYPDQSNGMPLIYDLSKDLLARERYFNRLPIHVGGFPQAEEPRTWVEMFFGTIPSIAKVSRTIYENADEGFYNFYIPNYKNIFFLPDFVSAFIQVQLNVCLDITYLEIIREIFFLGMVFYYQIVVIRITVMWFIYINPYTVPWCYIVAVVDWTEDALQGFLPTFLGVNVTSSLFLKFLGKIADSLNHLVFTMPFLPSEGSPARININGKPTEVLLFHYLPTLWYTHPIPNYLREFWYYQRPDIFKYMTNQFKHLEINFLPDEILNELSNLDSHQLSLEGFSQMTDFLHCFLL